MRPYALLILTVLSFAALTIANWKKKVPWFINLSVGLPVATIGVLNHHYFVVYAVLLLLLFVAATALGERGLPVSDRLTSKSFVAISLYTIMLGLAFAYISWAQGREPLNYDVFEFTRPEGGVLRVLADTSLQFLPMPQLVSVVSSALIILIFCFIAISRVFWRYPMGSLLLQVFVATGLMTVAFVAAGIITVASYLSGYWILNRQWVASLALVPIGTVWFLAALYTYLKPRVKWVAYGLAAASFLVIGAMAAYRLYGQVGALQSYAATAAEYREKYAGATIADSQRLYDELGPVEAANVNIYLGGPVWPVFSCFYGCEEGYQDRSR
jgi:hypothetical protein